MPELIKITVDGYLKKTYLGQEGEKDVTIQYSAKDAIKLAQLELIGRDLINHLPVLLRTTYEISPDRKAARIQNPRGITGKNRKVF